MVVDLPTFWFVGRTTKLGLFEINTLDGPPSPNLTPKLAGARRAPFQQYGARPAPVNPVHPVPLRSSRALVEQFEALTRPDNGLRHVYLRSTGMCSGAAELHEGTTDTDDQAASPGHLRFVRPLKARRIAFHAAGWRRPMLCCRSCRSGDTSTMSPPIQDVPVPCAKRGVQAVDAKAYVHWKVAQGFTHLDY